MTVESSRKLFFAIMLLCALMNRFGKKTEITRYLSSFPGILGEFLQETTPQEILRAEKFLPHIFWRWYMLAQPPHNISPYHDLEWLQKRENWPKDGQFFPKPSLKIAKTNDPFLLVTKFPKVQIDITVDYISFDEQPLIVDVIHTLDGKQLQYHYDKQYTQAISYLVILCEKEKLTVNNIKEDPKLLLIRQNLKQNC